MTKLSKEEFVKMFAKNQKERRYRKAELTSCIVDNKMRMKRRYDGKNLRSQRRG